jgi:hypothetical protein
VIPKGGETSCANPLRAYLSLGMKIGTPNQYLVYPLGTNSLPTERPCLALFFEKIPGKTIIAGTVLNLMMSVLEYDGSVGGSVYPMAHTSHVNENWLTRKYWMGEMLKGLNEQQKWVLHNSLQ